MLPYTQEKRHAEETAMLADHMALLSGGGFGVATTDVESKD